AGVVAVHRDARRASVDRDRRRAPRQAQLELRAPQLDGRGDLSGVELNRVRAASVECATDLVRDLRAEAARQGVAVDEGNGLAQRQVLVGWVGGIERAVDREDGRGQAVFQRLDARAVVARGLADRPGHRTGEQRADPGTASHEESPCQNSRRVPGRGAFARAPGKANHCRFGDDVGGPRAAWIVGGSCSVAAGPGETSRLISPCGLPLHGRELREIGANFFSEQAQAAVPDHRVTELLRAAQAGDASAAAQLLELVYAQLHELARARMAHLPPGQTLQPTALVHEAYLRLAAKQEMNWESRQHFFFAVA